MERLPSNSKSDDDSMRGEYDFRGLSGAVRGKYAKRYQAEEPRVRILRKDGTVEEGSLSEMRKKFELAELPDEADCGGITFVAVPNELLPEVQALIARGK